MSPRLVLVAPAILTLALAGCGEESAAPPAPAQPQAPAPPPEPAVSEADVLGEWAVEPVCMSNLAFNMVKVQLEARGREFSTAEIDEALQPVLKQWQLSPPVFNFKADKTLVIKAGDSTTNATWSLAGDTVTVVFDDEGTEAQYSVMPGYLSNITMDPSRRPVHLIRK